MEDDLPEEGGLVLGLPVLWLEDDEVGVGEHAAEPVDQRLYVEHRLPVGLLNHKNWLGYREHGQNKPQNVVSVTKHVPVAAAGA